MEIVAMIAINAIVFFVGVFFGLVMTALLKGSDDSESSVDWYGQDKY